MCRNKQRVLRTQFDIMFGKTPYIVMLHRGHTYRFKGDRTDQEALIDFAIETFHESDHKTQVPIMPTLLDEIRDLFNYGAAHKGGLLNAMLMRDEKG